MEIKLFDIIAGMVNFFILVFLLNKLFYKPVINAMEERQAKLERDKAEAKKLMTEANERVTEYEGRLADMETTRQDIITQAREEAKAEYNKLMDKYGREAEQKRDSFAREVKKEQDDFLRGLRHTVGESVVKISGQLLSSLSGMELREHVFNLFVERLRDVKTGDLQGNEANKATLYSVEELNDDQKSTLMTVLQETLGKAPDIKYEVNSDLVMGYELHFDTLTVQKSGRKYLEESGREVKAALERLHD